MGAHRYRFVIVAALGLLGCSSANQGSADARPGIDAQPAVCEADQTRCSGGVFQSCSEGQWATTEVCAGFCETTRGCLDCEPGGDHCFEDDVYACDADGNRLGLIEACEGETHCLAGGCTDLCETAASTHSYIGCEYWAVDLDNAIEVFEPGMGAFGCATRPGTVARNDLPVCHANSGPVKIAGLCDENDTCPSGFLCETTEVCVLDAQHSPFAIVVSNPQSFDVEVTLEDVDGTPQVATVSPGSVETLFPQTLGFADRSLDRSGITPSAYKLSSSAPIVAYQFNPLDNVDVFSNDGSILLPRTAFGESYLGMSQPTVTRRPQTNDYNGYLTVVAWQPDTQITVTPTAGVRAQGAFAAIAAGQTATFTLGAFEVLNLESVADGDLTGSTVQSLNNTSFAVFGGHEAVRIAHTTDSCCSDHIEEQLFPAETWGKQYAVARSKERGLGEADVLRILAQRDNTIVTLSPAVATCPTLAAGDFCDVDISEDVELSASEPILIGHYLKSIIVQDATGVNGNGDPSMALSVPTEQFRSTYSFLVPDQYDEQYISVVVAAGDALTLDGSDVSDQLASFASGAYRAGRIPIGAGSHQLSCANGCGLEVYGYSGSVSYLFAGGLDLEPIVID